MQINTLPHKLARFKNNYCYYETAVANYLLAHLDLAEIIVKQRKN